MESDAAVAISFEMGSSSQLRSPSVWSFGVLQWDQYIGAGGGQLVPTVCDLEMGLSSEGAKFVDDPKAFWRIVKTQADCETSSQRIAPCWVNGSKMAK